MPDTVPNGNVKEYMLSFSYSDSCSSTKSYLLPRAYGLAVFVVKDIDSSVALPQGCASYCVPKGMIHSVRVSFHGF